jgi:hypothetical protein
MRRAAPCHPRSRRAFSIAEMLIALTITATLMTAVMTAVDASFKAYKVTSESASTHVVARIVMQRLTAMIRTGQEFGPYPVNPITTPVLESDRIQFISRRDPTSSVFQVTELRRDNEAGGTFTLVYQVTTFDGATLVETGPAVPLLDGMKELRFISEWDVGPRLRRVTIDMVVQPDDLQDAAVAADLDTPYLRLVASASPRRID